MIKLTLATNGLIISVNPSSIDCIYPAEDDCTSIQVAGTKFDVLESRKKICKKITKYLTIEAIDTTTLVSNKITAASEILKDVPCKLNNQIGIAQNAFVFSINDKTPKIGERVLISFDDNSFICGPYLIHEKEPVYRYVGTEEIDIPSNMIPTGYILLG